MADDNGQPTTVTDGRTARALRTRDALVDATMALIEEGDLRPTAPRIAERAKVSVRSVFQHFTDLESLFSLLGDRTFTQIAEIFEPIDPDLPLTVRIDRFVDQRSRINERITPINRAAMTHLGTSATIDRQFRDGHRLAAHDAAHVFRREIAAAGDQGEVLLDALMLACGWATWNLLRGLEDHSAEEATERVGALARLALVGVGALDR